MIINIRSVTLCNTYFNLSLVSEIKPAMNCRKLRLILVSEDLNYY